jgi:hypothetical protein
MKINGEKSKRLSRHYTILPPLMRKGIADFLIKIYRAEGKFEGGRITTYL